MLESLLVTAADLFKATDGWLGTEKAAEHATCLVGGEGDAGLVGAVL